MDTVKHVVYGEERKKPKVYEWELSANRDGIMLRYRPLGWESWPIFVDATTPTVFVNANSFTSKTNLEVKMR